LRVRRGLSPFRSMRWALWTRRSRTAIGVGGVADQRVPSIDGKLAGDDGGLAAVAVLEDLQEVVASRDIERFAHLKRILKLGRLRLRGPQGAQDEFVLAAIAQNLRRFASLVARAPHNRSLWRTRDAMIAFEVAEAASGQTRSIPADIRSGHVGCPPIATEFCGAAKFRNVPNNGHLAPIPGKLQ
jgi:hypothetical protein